MFDLTQTLTGGVKLQKNWKFDALKWEFFKFDWNYKSDENSKRLIEVSPKK